MAADAARDCDAVSEGSGDRAGLEDEVAIDVSMRIASKIVKLAADLDPGLLRYLSTRLREMADAKDALKPTP